jgi:LacI family transcriptional regulator
MKNTRKVRINDVAAAAGVSIATVSRALSKPEIVAHETRVAVESVVKKLGYVVNGGARALSSKKSWSVGAVIPSLENAIFANTTYALQKTFGDEGYMLLVACSEYDLDYEISLVKGFIERGVDGLVLVGATHRQETKELLQRFKLPYVYTWAFEESGKLPIVGFNHAEATRLVTRHLLELGHSKFGVISTPTAGNVNALSRLNGVLSTLEESGIVLSEKMIVEAPFSYRKGSEAFSLLMTYSEKPTAVICLNDVLAIGAMAAARKLRLKVPKDVSITGCEDLEVAEFTNPPLTTVRYPTAEMGNYAARHILSQLKKEKPILQRIFPTKLVVRKSSGPPKR